MDALVATVPPAPPDISIARLHGEACYTCGAALCPLTPAGAVRVRIEGGWRVWPVVACSAHVAGGVK
ncbi:hypothetical protein ACIP9H_40595 [Streptomyces sp. NPDC088732]|uniref:hypothetical protein n=1 Tax=Streptomyces sp. NPDC088732 TaxID=3365879 RepID=UPI0038031475